MGSKTDRRGERFRVHLSVRYETALDFVTEYADNLSSGGLFLRGSEGLELRARVTVEMELPGYKTFKLEAEVAHIMTQELADSCGRKPGAGLAIVKAPPGFQDALSSYFQRLGRRRDFKVLVNSAECRKLIEGTGYVAEEAPPPADLAAAIARSEIPVIAVVVSRALEKQYADAAAMAGDPDLVKAIDYLEEVEELLTLLDESL